MFATPEQITDLERMIKSVLNATTLGWAGAIDDARRSNEVITKSRLYGTIEVIKAIAKNPQHGYWGALASQVEVEHDSFIKGFTGSVGIPQIQPFTGAKFQTGMKADPDEIDSYRNDEIGQFSKTPHNQKDANDMPSPVALYYSIVNSQVKFTGKVCTVPMIRLRDVNYDTKLPFELIPTVLKLAVFYCLKEGDNLGQIAQPFYQMGMADLKEIESGRMSTPALADIAEIQKEI